MQPMSFRDRACTHLTGYRKDVLGIAEDGVFLHRGTEHRKGHILPGDRHRENLLAPYRDAFFAEHGDTKLHRYFHHLNSSQALCINLFYPLLKADPGLLARVLRTDMPLPFAGVFESDSRIERAERRTSFDFHLRNGERDLYVEVKYTEDGFGGAEADAEHLAKFRATYAPLLRDSPYLTGECHDAAFFLRHYQVLRNFVHVGPQSEVVFLFPRANLTVAAQAAHARATFLTDAGRERMHIVFLEDVVDELVAACRGTPLEGHYDAFRRKYLAFDR